MKIVVGMILGGALMMGTFQVAKVLAQKAVVNSFAAAAVGTPPVCPAGPGRILLAVDDPTKLVLAPFGQKIGYILPPGRADWLLANCPSVEVGI